MNRSFVRILAALLAVSLLGGCAAAAPQTPEVAALSAADYPQMAPYPDESAFVDAKTGEFDSDGFSAAYDAWRDSRQQLSVLPAGCADSLKPFFREAIPAFLAQGDVCSPVNVYMALALLARCTAGETREQILTLVGADSAEALIAQAGQVWNSHYCADGANATVLANSLWLDRELAYDAETVQTLSRELFASVFQGDLGSEAMNQALQQWLNDQTDGLLSQQAQGVEMSPDTVLALASTILYRAKWRGEFREAENTQGIFHSPGGQREVTYMNRQLTYGPYYWAEDFAAVALPLEDGSRMWVILPDEDVTPRDLLEEGTALELALSGGDWADQKSLRVNLSLPKFDVADDLALKAGLQSLGITRVFEPAQADFSAILPEDAGWLDKVQHAARVAIDEEGITAAAYTVMMTAGASMPPKDEVDFIADRPFLFVVTSRENLPLFAGIVDEP